MENCEYSRFHPERWQGCHAGEGDIAGGGRREREIQSESQRSLIIRRFSSRIPRYKYSRGVAARGLRKAEEFRGPKKGRTRKRIGHSFIEDGGGRRRGSLDGDEEKWAEARTRHVAKKGNKEVVKAAGWLLAEPKS